jgi:hypothetical protein
MLQRPVRISIDLFIVGESEAEKLFLNCMIYHTFSHCVCALCSRDNRWCGHSVPKVVVSKDCRENWSCSWILGELATQLE